MNISGRISKKSMPVLAAIAGGLVLACACCAATLAYFNSIGAPLANATRTQAAKFSATAIVTPAPMTATIQATRSNQIIAPTAGPSNTPTATVAKPTNTQPLTATNTIAASPLPTDTRAPTQPPTTQAPLPTQPPPTQTPAAVNYDHNGDGKVTCADFNTQAGAQAAYEAGYTNLDGNDKDGRACESLP